MENTEEIWKDILELNSLYQVSNKGNIRRKQRFAKSVIIKCGYINLVAKDIKTQCNYKGYKKVNICLNGKKIIFMAHRLVATYFIENPLGKEQVNHINGIKDDNRVENLEWCTGSENIRHAMKTGLAKNFGTGSYKSKLTDKQVLKIRELYSHGIEINEIVKDIGIVMRSTIMMVIKRKTWKHI